jgi:hypothetical protein
LAPRASIRSWRAGRQCTFRIGNALQIAVLDFHQVGGVLRSRGAVGDDESDCFTDETHALVREHRPLRGSRLHAVLADEGYGMRRPDVPGAHRVFAGKYALYTRERSRVLRVHRNDFGMRPVGAHEVAIELPLRAPIRGVLARTGDEAEIFYPTAVVMVMGFGAHCVSRSFLGFDLFGKHCGTGCTLPRSMPP